MDAVYQFTDDNGTEFRFLWRTDSTGPNSSRKTTYSQHRFPGETEWRNGADIAPVFVEHMIELANNRKCVVPCSDPTPV